MELNTIPDPNFETKTDDAFEFPKTVTVQD